MMNLHDIPEHDVSKYRLIGTSVLSFRFAVPYDEPIFVGEILKISDSAKDLTFFCRISDLFHDSNFADRKWDTRPHTERFYDIGEDVYLIAEASPLGYVGGDGVFRSPKTIPTKFSRVERPDSRDLDFLTRLMGDIEIGFMKTGQDVIRDVRVALHADRLSQHMGVFATTGMGKSNFMKVFCASCMQEQKFGLLVVDPHGEYVAGGQSSTGDPTSGLLAVQAGKEGLSVFTTRDEKFRKKYALNRLFLDYDDFRTPDLHLLYDHSGPQSDLIETLEYFPGSDVIGFFMDTNFTDFDPETYTGGYGHIVRELGSNFHPSTLSVIQRRIKSLIRSNHVFFRETGSAVPDIIKALHENRVVLIDIPGMTERSELFVLSILARRILRNHQGEDSISGTDSADTAHRVLIAIEEAQRVLGQEARGARIFRECAMEGRKFGVGLCVITQQPRNVDARVLAQLNTLVIMGLSDRSDRSTVSSSAKQDLSAMDTEIQTLETGEAIISTPGIPFPVSTRIHLFEEYITQNTPKKRSDIRKGLQNSFR
jgi:DNA helicase HerA-like ATPase